MNRSIMGVALAAAAAILLTGCSMPSTADDETAIHVGDGITEGQPVKGCVPAGTRQVNGGTGWGDDYFFYPENQRLYDFTGKDDSDAKPIEVVSKDNQRVFVPGTISFDLNTDCEVLKRFHKNIGKRYQAYMVDGDGGRVTGDGWKRVLNLYIGRAADATLDRVAKQYTWRELYSDPAIKDKMNSEVDETIRTLVNQQTDGNDEFFLHFSSLIQQPVPDEALVQALRDEQTTVAQAQANEAKAVADARAAEAAANSQVAQKQAELQVAQIQAQIKAAEIAAYGGVQNYNNAKAIEKGLNPFQPVYGATIQSAQ